MLAASIIQPRRTIVVEAPFPEPGPGQVTIRVEGCGLCASTLPLWEGRDWFNYPTAPGESGHEAWGKITALGPGVEGFSLGEPVATVSFHALAEYDAASAAAVVRLPAALYGLPFPGEPIGCAMNIAARCDFAPGHTVAIVGIGFLGAILCRLASRAGANVIAISRRRFALEFAQRFGAEQTLEMDNEWERTADALMSRTGGKGCERVVEAAGLQSTLDLASAIVAERGRLIVAGYHQDGLRVVNMQQWNWRGIDVVNAHERNPDVYTQGIRAAAAAVAARVIDPAPLFTHRFALNEIDRAFETMRTRPDGFMKALIIP